MSYLKEINWVVVPTTTPTVKKNCSKCGHHATFVNSEKFRVNANKNKLDVWLIYQCEKCKSTWNMTIYERIAPKDIPEEAYQFFLENDRQLARAYGFDKGLHSRNKVMLDYENVVYTVEGKSVDWIRETDLPHEDVRIKIVCEKPFDLRLDKLLSYKLGISRSQIKTLHKSGVISGVSKENVLKEKVHDELLVSIKIGADKQ